MRNNLTNTRYTIVATVRQVKMLLLSVPVFFCFSLKAQPIFPPDGIVYNDTMVPRIDILIDPDSLAYIYSNLINERELPATFVFNDGIHHDTVENAGFRLRGNTSLYSAKKSFKVSFNTFTSGGNYRGFEKLNLNGEHNDPSVIRSKICWDILRSCNIPAPRSNHIRLYINQNYYGLYINVEHIDEEFVMKRFGNQDGNLYKCLWPADLTYLGNNPDVYKFESNGRRAYELKTNEAIDDYSDLAHFIDVLNNTPSNQFPCAIEKVFNIQDYLKIIVLDILTANWDGYIFNKNNFYLYHNTATGKFEYIPYDLDNTMGIDWFGIDWSTRNIYDWSNSESRPLYDRIMNSSHFKDQFTFSFQQVLNSISDTSVLFPEIRTIKAMITPYVQTDPYYPLDYGFSINDFHDSYYQAIGMHIPIGLFPYFSNRNGSASNQLIIHDTDPAIKYIWHNFPRLDDDILFRCHAEDDDPGLSVILEYSVNGGALQTIPMLDDGNHNDFLPGDHFYGCIIPGLSHSGTIDYRIKGEDISGNITYTPCSPDNIDIFESSTPLLYINEFMASNDQVIPDEFGEYDDWVEIFNGDTLPVWLGNKYLSDNLNNPDKWKLPDTIIHPGEFLLIWADDDPSQGPFHTSFKLSADGEELGIFDSQEYGHQVLDQIVFGIQQTDISFGRLPDGGQNWVTFSTPTPGFSNNQSSINEHQKHTEPLFFPNPANEYIMVTTPVTCKISDLSGKTVRTYNNKNMLHIKGISPGFYLIKVQNGHTAKIIIY